MVMEIVITSHPAVRLLGQELAAALVDDQTARVATNAGLDVYQILQYLR